MERTVGSVLKYDINTISHTMLVEGGFMLAELAIVRTFPFIRMCKHNKKQYECYVDGLECCSQFAIQRTRNLCLEQEKIH